MNMNKTHEHTLWKCEENITRAQVVCHKLRVKDGKTVRETAFSASRIMVYVSFRLCGCARSWGNLGALGRWIVCEEGSSPLCIGNPPSTLRPALRESLSHKGPVILIGIG